MALVLALLATSVLLIVDGMGSGSAGRAGTQLEGELPEAGHLFSARTEKASGSDGAEQAVPRSWADEDAYVRTTDGAVEAYDPASGRRLWRTALGGQVCSSAPTTSKKGVAVVVVREQDEGYCARLSAIDTGTGERLWQRSLPSHQDGWDELRSTSTVLFGDLAVVAWGDGHGAFRLSDGSTAWSAATGRCSGFGYTGRTRLLAVAVCGGKPEVREVAPESGRTVRDFSVPWGKNSLAPVVVSDAPLVLLVRNGTDRNRLLRPGKTGKPVWQRELRKRYDPQCGLSADVGPEGCRTAVAGDGVLALTTQLHGTSALSYRNEVVGINLRTGRKSWRADSGDGNQLHPVRSSGRGLIAVRSGMGDASVAVVRIDGRTGRQHGEWRTTRSTGRKVRPMLASVYGGDMHYAAGRLYLESAAEHYDVRAFGPTE